MSSKVAETKKGSVKDAEHKPDFSKCPVHKTGAAVHKIWRSWPLFILVSTLIFLRFGGYNWGMQFLGFHAGCEVTFTVPDMNCDDLSAKLVDNAQNCAQYFPSVRENQYTNIENNGSTLTMKHVTPVHRYVDDVSFTFVTDSEGGCVAKASSKSEPFSYLDYCTNFCNSWNLFRNIESVNWTSNKCSPGCPPEHGKETGSCDKY
eukprot:Clim_evm18s161 gene=Clim_evmTU18s161